MSTTGVYGFRIDGRDKVTFYGHDSFPEGLGESFLETISGSNLENLTKIAREIILVDKKEYMDFFNFGDGFFNTFEVGLGKPLKMVDFQEELLKPKIEWAYILNLDNWSFETYSGSNGVRDKNAPGRYSNLSLPGQEHIPGVRLLDEIPLKEVLRFNARDRQDYVKRVENLEQELSESCSEKDYIEIEERWKRKLESN